MTFYVFSDVAHVFSNTDQNTHFHQKHYVEEQTITHRNFSAPYFSHLRLSGIRLFHFQPSVENLASAPSSIRRSFVPFSCDCLL